MPIKVTKGRAVFLHGYSGHSGQPSIRQMADVLYEQMGFTVFTVDFPFHGLSNDPEKPEDLGKITSFRQWVNTVGAATRQVLKLRSEKNPGTFFICESAGALAEVRFLQLNPEIQKYIAGVVIVAIPLEVDQNAAKWIQKYKRLIEPVFSFVALFLPNLGVGDLPPGNKEDKLEKHGKIGARPAKELRDAAIAARRAMKGINVPILFIHGDSDNVALREPVEIAYHEVATPEDKKEFIVYRGAPHRVLQQAMGDIRRWMEKRNEAKDWVPFQEEGVVNETVKLSAALLFALKLLLLYIPTIFPLVRKNLAIAWKKIIRKS
ncbi:MAG: alpha/beta hydrolase [bacterium]|nr:alpha/beta hydrolase [bacterium]